MVSGKRTNPRPHKLFFVKNAKAGQFIIFRAEENGERVPLTIADVDKEKGELTLVFMAVGYSTKKLAQLEVGDELVDLVGVLFKQGQVFDANRPAILEKSSLRPFLQSHSGSLAG